MSIDLSMPSSAITLPGSSDPEKEASAGLVTAAVFKTVEASETMPGGFDSHPLPLERDAGRLAMLVRLCPSGRDTLPGHA